MDKHSWAIEKCLEDLIASSGRPYSSKCEEPVANLPEETGCGWKSARPCAEYHLSLPAGRRKRHSNYIRPHSQIPVPKHTSQWPYMSGQLDEDFCYSYTGGLSSSRVQGAGPGSKLLAHTHAPTTYHKQVVSLDPVIPYRSVHMDIIARKELSAILAMQLKPELLVEQLIIENRLRTMSLSTFQPLEGIGLEKKSKRISAKSQSTPALLLPQAQHHRKHKRQRIRPKGSLEWCKLGGAGSTAGRPDEGEEEEGPAILMPFQSNQSRTGFSGSAKQTALQLQQPGMMNLGGGKVLPVVSPELNVKTGKHKKRSGL